MPEPPKPEMTVDEKRQYVLKLAATKEVAEQRLQSIEAEIKQVTIGLNELQNLLPELNGIKDTLVKRITTAEQEITRYQKEIETYESVMNIRERYNILASRQLLGVDPLAAPNTNKKEEAPWFHKPQFILAAKIAAILIFIAIGIYGIIAWTQSDDKELFMFISAFMFLALGLAVLMVLILSSNIFKKKEKTKKTNYPLPK